LIGVDAEELHYRGFRHAIQPRTGLVNFDSVSRSVNRKTLRDGAFCDPRNMF